MHTAGNVLLCGSDERSFKRSLDVAPFDIEDTGRVSEITIDIQVTQRMPPLPHHCHHMYKKLHTLSPFLYTAQRAQPNEWQPARLASEMETLQPESYSSVYGRVSEGGGVEDAD